MFVHIPDSNGRSSFWKNYVFLSISTAWPAECSQYLFFYFQLPFESDDFMKLIILLSSLGWIFYSRLLSYLHVTAQICIHLFSNMSLIYCRHLHFKFNSYPANCNIEPFTDNFCSLTINTHTITTDLIVIQHFESSRFKHPRYVLIT